MTNDKILDAIYQAKREGMADNLIMKHYSVGLREIERAIVKNTGVNLNLIRTINGFRGLNPSNFLPESTTVWSFKSRGNWATHNGDYRGNWSPYIPRNIILRYSKPGDLVLDQFCGAGTTAVEAKLLGRKCEARDISPAAVEIAKKNTEFPVVIQETLERQTHFTVYDPSIKVGDARDLSDIADNSIDLICTHPPYANIIHYSDCLDGDLSFYDIDEFVNEMQIVARECFRVLKPEGTCVFLIGDTRRKKRVVPLGFLTIDVFLKHGFTLKELIIKRQHNCRTTGFWYSSSLKHNFLLLSQEYLPVFIKPSSKLIRNSTRPSHSLHHHLSKTKKPSPPSEMQCKTTWVLDTKMREQQLDANLFNRYGGSGAILCVDFVEKELTDANEILEKSDLLYLKTLSGYYQRCEYVGPYLQKIADLISLLIDKVKCGGYIAIRLKDFRDNGMIFSPALLAWQIPLSSLKICEIIIATSDEKHDMMASEDLKIDHEYILVYQKETTESESK